MAPEFRRARSFLVVFSLVLAAGLFPRFAFAQFDAATVLGTVRDSSGAVVPGATVTLKNAATGITATAVTDEHGNYRRGRCARRQPSSRSAGTRSRRTSTA